MKTIYFESTLAILFQMGEEDLVQKVLNTSVKKTTELGNYFVVTETKDA